ncbi:MAG TPA: hypothetical protein DEP66_03865, partial [Acidimicrobiaceae bacterium]|nr:hypothetical protein [Acidimicrobiaceae bacterium]
MALARMLADCRDVDVAPAAFALLNGVTPVDAAAAAPTLGAGLGRGGSGSSDGSGPSDGPALVPVLVVDDTLPG